MRKILGIDFGLKHLGIAITEGELVEVWGGLEFKGEKKTGEKIKRICEEEKIEGIVVGITGGKLEGRIKGFGKKLEETTKLPVYFQDETLSSKEARKKMIEAGKGKKKRKKDEHVVAACLILEEWLDQRE